ncbi:hypothetical protein O3P69_017670 [Scylla paramamosain]|uniref:Phospholipase A2-like central domain-containing protein n=2 Tax=Scylla TaxID=6760 RepID=A0AAW0TY76_SCYPA
MSPHSVTLMGLLLTLVSLLPFLLAVSGQALPNFVAQDDLNDGQHEIRIHYNGISAKQTSVRRDQGSDSGLVLRQIHHHHRLLTLVYVGEAADDLSVDGLSLRDCRLSGDAGEVSEFMEKFEEDAAVARTTAAGEWSGSLNNVTFVHLNEEEELPQYLRPVLHFKKLRAQCREHRRSVKRAVRAQRRLERRNNQHHSNNNNHHHAVAEGEATTTHSHQSHSRSKRSLLSLRMPFTKWCGAHYDANTYGDLGGLVRVDHCCRQHDLHCPYFIEFMTEKYGLWNTNLGTINHCGCDLRFKACLKMTGTAAADLVGDVFFNKMKTKCFSLEKKKVCTKWASWFGPCTKYSIKQVAVLRDNVAYKF